MLSKSRNFLDYAPVPPPACRNHGWKTTSTKEPELLLRSLLSTGITITSIVSLENKENSSPFQFPVLSICQQKEAYRDQHSVTTHTKAFNQTPNSVPCQSREESFP